MIFLDNSVFSGQIGSESRAQAVEFMVELGGIEPPTSCMPCDGSFARKPLTEQLKLPLETSRIVARTAALSLGFARNWLGNSGRFLSSAQIEYARVSGLDR